MEVAGQEILTRDKVEPAPEPDRAVAGDGRGEGAFDGEQRRRVRLQGAAVRAARGGGYAHARRAADRQGRDRPRGRGVGGEARGQRSGGALGGREGRDPAGRDEDHPQPGGRGGKGGAGQPDPPPRGNGRDPFAAEHRASHGREPDAAASEGAGDAGEGDGEGGFAHRLRRPRRRVEEPGAWTLRQARRQLGGSDEWRSH